MEYLPEAQGSPGQQYYMNEDERNIHVWCSWSKVCSSPQFRDKVTPGIVAGDICCFFIMDTANHAFRVLHA